MATRIHPTAIVDPSARLGEDVEIGPYVIVEADTAIGSGCRLLASCMVRRFSTLGERNVVHPFTVIGGEPQDHGFDPKETSFVLIGNDNVFREGCTVNRATGQGKSTIVGNSNLLMTAAHVGHNSIVGSHCIMVNGSALGGHTELHDRAILSAHVSVHQFCWVGEMVMSQGNCLAVQHVPPYCMFRGVTDLVGLNRVGLRRAPDITAKDRTEVQVAYRLMYRSGLPTGRALQEMDAHPEWGPVAGKFRDFIRRVFTAKPPYNRGLAKPDINDRDNSGKE